MEENKNNMCPCSMCNGNDCGNCSVCKGNECKCPDCKWGGMYHRRWGYGRHYLIKCLIGLVFFLVVFAIGVKVGEFKAQFNNFRYYNSGNGMMLQFNPSDMPMYQGQYYR